MFIAKSELFGEMIVRSLTFSRPIPESEYIRFDELNCELRFSAMYHKSDVTLEAYMPKAKKADWTRLSTQLASIMIMRKLKGNEAAC